MNYISMRPRSQPPVWGLLVVLLAFGALGGLRQWLMYQHFAPGRDAANYTSATEARPDDVVYLGFGDGRVGYNLPDWNDPRRVFGVAKREDFDAAMGAYYNNPPEFQRLAQSGRCTDFPTKCRATMVDPGADDVCCIRCAGKEWWVSTAFVWVKR